MLELFVTLVNDLPDVARMGVMDLTRFDLWLGLFGYVVFEDGSIIP